MFIHQIFCYPKEDDDIYLVYDATVIRLNEYIWSLLFWMPTIESLLQALEADSWMMDQDYGDMFLNFELDKYAWPFVGIDIGPLFDGDRNFDYVSWFHWVCNMPYDSIKMSLVADEVIHEDRHGHTNH